MKNLKPTHLYVLGWILLTTFMFLYVNQAKNGTIDCFYKWSQVDRQVTVIRSNAAERRDDALVRSKLTMGRIVELRIGERKTDSDVLAYLTKLNTSNTVDYNDTQALSRYYVQTVIDYVTAQHDLDKVRDQNPPADIRKVCK